jgi:hypothetical protein
MAEYRADQFTLTSEGWYVAEASDLGICAVEFPPDEVVVRAASGAEHHFTYSHVEMDASGEDVAGWRYRSEARNIIAGLLIIND